MQTQQLTIRLHFPSDKLLHYGKRLFQVIAMIKTQEQKFVFCPWR
jgi:hypothetical protein